MPKQEMSFVEVSATDYARFPTVIDVSMGEFAFSDFYPLHSDSYATCLGVVVGAADGFGVALAHLDPLAGAGKGKFYGDSLDHIITTLLLLAKATSCDVCFFADGFRAVEKFQLVKFVTTRFGTKVRSVTDKTGIGSGGFNEVIAMPSAFHSAYVCLKPWNTAWTSFRTGKNVLAGENGNETALKLGRARELTFGLVNKKEHLFQE